MMTLRYTCNEESPVPARNARRELLRRNSSIAALVVAEWDFNEAEQVK